MIKKITLWKLNKILGFYKYSKFSLEYDVELSKPDDKEWEIINKKLKEIETKINYIKKVMELIKND